MERDTSSVQVGIGLADVRVAEQLPDVVQGHSGVEPTRPCLMSQVVKVKVTKSRTHRRTGEGAFNRLASHAIEYASVPRVVNGLERLGS